MRYITALITLFFILAVSSPAHAQTELGPGFYDHIVPYITYSGTGITWSTITDSNNYGGSRITSGQVTSTAPRIDFAIWGSGFALHILRNPVGADASLCINGICSGITYYSATNQYTTINITNLGYGSHTISIQKTSVTNTAINLDALYVAPPVLPPTLAPITPIVVVTLIMPTQPPTSTPQPTPTGTVGVWVLNLPEETPETTPDYQVPIEIGGQATIINYQINPLDVVLVILVTFGVFILMVTFVVNIWRAK